MVNVCSGSPLASAAAPQSADRQLTGADPRPGLAVRRVRPVLGRWARARPRADARPGGPVPLWPAGSSGHPERQGRPRAQQI